MNTVYTFRASFEATFTNFNKSKRRCGEIGCCVEVTHCRSSRVFEITICSILQVERLLILIILFTQCSRFYLSHNLSPYLPLFFNVFLKGIKKKLHCVSIDVYLWLTPISTTRGSLVVCTLIRGQNMRGSCLLFVNYGKLIIQDGISGYC